jgi:predicted RNase H-like nuclease
MYLISGIDGCRGGWFTVFKDIDSGKVSWGIFPRIETLIRSQPELQIIAIDIPIGLSEIGPRTCDIEARRVLGKGRGSSVFSAPIRPMLAANSYREACDIGFQIEGRKLSYQTWGILPKIREVDTLLQIEHKLREKMFEVHPEVSFFFLGGECRLLYGKKALPGHEERLRLLEPFFRDWLQAALSERQKPICAIDDILDAFAVLWTAERIMFEKAQFLPHKNIQDATGLRMAIVA